MKSRFMERAGVRAAVKIKNRIDANVNVNCYN